MVRKIKTPESLLIENPYYIDKSEFVNEMKKSTPLLAEVDKYEDVKYEITFQYFPKNKKYDQKIKNLISSLQEKEYITFNDQDNQLVLFGKVARKGYIIINQNINQYWYIISQLDKFIIVFTLLTFMVILFLYYLFYLKQKLHSSNIGLNETYEQLFEDTKKMAFEDKLTKAATRLKFDETLKDLIQVASRFEEQTFSVMMIDIDNFKSVNDTYGHDYGDVVLKAVSGEILRYKKSSETFARWGGEEFVILLPLTRIEKSVIFAEKLRKEISLIPFERLKRVTCSFGITEYRQGDDEKTIIKRADELLYQAKQQGKNRVIY